jgi:general nucleoside transport system permease protein
VITDLLRAAFIISLLSGMLRIATPILLAALGELVTERAGVMNLGVEGTMLMGAFVGFLVANKTGSLWLAVVVGMIAGGIMAGLLAFMACILKADQTITGLAINLFAAGISYYWYRITYPLSASENAELPTINIFHTVNIPFLSKIPYIGEILFSQHILTYFALILVPVIWFFLYRTKLGLELRCLGEKPRVIDMRGLNVTLRQFLAVIFGGLMAGLGGAFLPLASTGIYVQAMTAGRGWLAIVIVIAGNWKPGRILMAALIFGLLDAIQLQAQGIGIKLPYQIFLALPYVLGIVIMMVSRSRSESPAALGVPYTRE